MRCTQKGSATDISVGGAAGILALRSVAPRRRNDKSDAAKMDRGAEKTPSSGFGEPLPRVAERDVPEGRKPQIRRPVAHLAEGILHPEHVG